MFCFRVQEVVKRKALGGCVYSTARDGERGGTDEISMRKNIFWLWKDVQTGNRTDCAVIHAVCFLAKKVAENFCKKEKVLLLAFYIFYRN